MRGGEGKRREGEEAYKEGSDKRKEKERKKGGGRGVGREEEKCLKITHT